MGNLSNVAVAMSAFITRITFASRQPCGPGVQVHRSTRKLLRLTHCSRCFVPVALSTGTQSTLSIRRSNCPSWAPATCHSPLAALPVALHRMLLTAAVQRGAEGISSAQDQAVSDDAAAYEGAGMPRQGWRCCSVLASPFRHLLYYRARSTVLAIADVAAAP